MRQKLNGVSLAVGVFSQEGDIMAAANSTQSVRWDYSKYIEIRDPDAKQCQAAGEHRYQSLLRCLSDNKPASKS